MLKAAGKHLGPNISLNWVQLLKWDSFYIWEQLGYPEWLAFLEEFSQIQKQSLTKDDFHYCKCTIYFLVITTSARCQKVLLTPGTARPPGALHLHPFTPSPGCKIKPILSSSYETNRTRKLASTIDLSLRIHLLIIFKCLIPSPFIVTVKQNPSPRNQKALYWIKHTEIIKCRRREAPWSEPTCFYSTDLQLAA